MKNVNVVKSRLSVGFTNNDDKFSSYWEKNNTFEKVNKLLNNKPFVLLDGPPYANGDAHLGHALNKMFKDLVVKSQWFMGNSVRYQPGWDCHGLPLELAVEKKYGKLETTVLKNRCKQLAFRSLVKQRKVFKDLGVLGDWDNPYVTLSKPMVKDSWKTLESLLNKDLLEYKQYPVHYCPACASSLAEAELENKELNKDSLYFKMKLSNNLYALVWTTTPWTLPMNQGLALHKNFTYEVWENDNDSVVLQNSNDSLLQNWLSSNNYHFVKNLLGEELLQFTAESPLTKNVVPVLHAEFVQSDKTGFVHMAFAHGPEDFELGQSHHLLPVSYLNKFGVFDTSLESLNFLNNKKYNQVQKLVCEKLSEFNLLVNYSNSLVEQQVCWRHKCGVYYNSTYQVFLKLEDQSYNLKNKVKNLLNESHLSSYHKERLSSMLLNRKHWCLSRQRKWGCPMNLVVHKDTHELNKKLSLKVLQLSQNNEDVSLFMSDYPEYLLFDDVLDVWFDSGNVVNNYHYNNPNSEDYMVDLALEGKDQFRGWFQSMLWLAVAGNEKFPYKNLFCHGFVLNEKREKLSKSSGNASSVSVYLKEYGADVLHLWVASQEPELDAVFSDAKLDEMKKYYSRLRLSLRFLTSNLYDYDFSNHQLNLVKFSKLEQFDLHRFVLNEMTSLFNQSCDYFKNYQFKKVLELLYAFCDKTLSNFYFDVLKNPLYLNDLQSDSRLLVQTGLYEVMLRLFNFTKVFMPFASEEFYQDYFGDNTSVYENNNLKLFSEFTVLFDWKELLELRKSVFNKLEPLQKNKVVKSRNEVSVNLKSFTNNLYSLEKYFELADLLNVSLVNMTTEGKNKNNEFELEVLSNNLEYKKCSRCWNYKNNKFFTDLLCNSCL